MLMTFSFSALFMGAIVTLALGGALGVWTYLKLHRKLFKGE